VEERLKERYKLRALGKAGLTGGRVLDIGCGRGEFLRLLRERGYEPHGLEPGEEAARRGREEYGLDIVHGTLGDVELQKGYYDAVTMWHVLEHLPDTKAALASARDALKGGGLLFIAAPDFGGAQARAFGARWFGIDAPRHLVHFTRGTLKRMLEAGGFSVSRICSGGARYETAMLVRSVFPGLNAMKLDAFAQGRASRYAYKALQLALDIALLPVGLALSSLGAGSTMIAVAKKSEVD
jgi:SAM-dependent methyltransferase